MARGTTLNQLLEKLRAECRFSTNTSRGIDDANYLRQILIRVQEQLYDEYTWPFLQILVEDADKILQAGERFYDFPDELNLERVIRVWHKFGNEWIELEQGISPTQYSSFDSDADVRSDPPIRWDIRDGRQFEIWPVPSSNGTPVRFQGTRLLTPLVEDTSRADLDDILIVLFSAGEILTSTKQPDAQIKLNLATRRLNTLRGQLSDRKRMFLTRGQNIQNLKRPTTGELVQALADAKQTF